MTHGSLFSGIGGFDLAAEWMGWDNLFHCEINEFGRLVLKYYWPNAKSYTDIRKTDFTVWRGLIDVLSGGFPCQPYSVAGKRKGKEDNRHLWPHMLRAVREIQPSYVVGENVRGLVNWNGGMVFDEVQADLEVEGYEVTPFLLPACAVNAPHRRDRIWFVAYRSNSRTKGVRPERQDSIHESIITSNSNGNGYRGNYKLAETGCSEEEIKGKEQREERVKIQREWYGSYVGGDDAAGDIANADSQQLEGNSNSGGYDEKGRENEGRQFTKFTRNDWSIWPTQSPVCNGNDGFPGGLVDFAVPGRKGTRILSGKQAYGRWRKESIAAMGNAIVPQVAYQIFQIINQHLAA